MSEPTDKYNHIIVWLDQNIVSPDCCKQLRKAFATTTNPESKTLKNIDELDISKLILDDSTYQQSSFLQVPFTFKLFSHVEPCLQYLLDNAGKKRIFFITSGSLGEYIVPRILTEYQHIFKDKDGKLYEDSIYIFCANMVKHGQWAIDYLELDCIKMEDDDLSILARLTRDIAKYFLSEGKEFLKNDKDILSLNKALKYLIWSKELYHKAQLVVKTLSSTSILKDIDQIIIETEFKIKQFNDENDQDKIGEQD
jgi:hypothetical protein